MTVTVFHNVTDARERFVRGYITGDPLVPVLTFVDHGDDIWRAATDAYRLLNVGDDPAFGEPSPIAVEYRARRNRSLSVGDVLRIDDVWLSCDSVGWSKLDEAPVDSIVRTSTHGTTYDPSAEAVTS